MESSQTTASPAAGPVFSKQNPFLAELVRHDRLTSPASGKDTRHFVLSLEGSGLTYTPGDSLGAFAQNSPTLIDHLLEMLKFDPLARLPDPRGKQVPLRDLLRRHYILNRANRKIVAGVVSRLPAGDRRDRLTALTQDPAQLEDYIDTRDYVDILSEFPEARFERPEDFIAQLSPVTPRLYSIASSLAAHPGEAHLCVEIVRYSTHGRSKKGLASGFLADHTETFVPNIPVYVQESRSFRLPADCARDIIMVGPGTGIAPFRAFLEQRIVEGAPGRNWLFFGEQHRATEFLYGPELEAWHQQGKLHRLDLAFSRDQDHKIYVQHRMRENARELWDWLKNGAYFYVCGDARHMAKDVHQTLMEIAATQGGLSPEAAAAYVNVTLMKTEKRYLRDVY